MLQLLAIKKHKTERIAIWFAVTTVVLSLSAGFSILEKDTSHITEHKNKSWSMIKMLLNIKKARQCLPSLELVIGLEPTIC